MKSKEKVRAAFIVKDAKSYVDVEEAWYRFKDKIEEAFLFVVIPRGYLIPERYVRKKEIVDVIDKEKWKEIVWVYTMSNNETSEFKLKMKKNWILNTYVHYREYIYNLIDRIQLDRVAKRYAPCELVVSGHKNTQEHLAAKLKPDKLYLVDAGLSVLKRVTSSGFIDYTSWYRGNILRRILFKLTGLKVFDREKTSMFTAYADQIETKHQIEKNSQDYKRAQIQNSEIGNDAIWISSPIHEMVKEVTLQSYLNYIKASLELLGIDGKNLIYIPHVRKEKSDDIKFIQKAIGCRVDERLLPVEVKIANLKKLPKVCISPLSSALVNLDVLAEGKMKMISAWHYEFNYFRVWYEWKQEVMKNKKLNIEFRELRDCQPLFYIDNKNGSETPIFETFRDWQLKMS